MSVYDKKVYGLECRCDGCRAKIKPSQKRETFSDVLEDGKPFTKTLCDSCVQEIVGKFKKHILEKEKDADPLQV